MRTVIVVGGGISGLAAAWALRERAHVVVVEADERVGGKLRTDTVAGVPVDVGAESMTAMRPQAVDLATAVGLGDAVCAPRPGPVTVWTRGRLHPMPPGHVLGIPTRPDDLAATGLLSEGGLERLRRADDLVPRPPSGDDVTVGAYLTPILGREAVDRLVAPLIGGIYGGDVDRLSLASVLPHLTRIAASGEPLLAALRARVVASGSGPKSPHAQGISGGLGRFAERVAEASGATVLTATRAEALETADGGWRVHARTPDRSLRLDADAVLLALPAQQTGSLLGPHAPHAAHALTGIPYASSAVVTLAFRRDAVARGALVERNGFLVPPVDGRTVKAATFLSTKWQWQADTAPDVFLLRASLAGPERTAAADPDLIADTLLELASAVGELGDPIATHVTRWHQGLPQYEAGHATRVRHVREAIDALPGLDVCGAAYAGVGVSSCVADGLAAADRLAAA